MVGVGFRGDGSLMLLRRHVYSSWYRRHTVAIEEPFSWPKCSASFLAMDSVDRRVPYKSNAMMMFFSGDMGIFLDATTQF